MKSYRFMTQKQKAIAKKVASENNDYPTNVYVRCYDVNNIMDEKYYIHGMVSMKLAAVYKTKAGFKAVRVKNIEEEEIGLSDCEFQFSIV